AGSGWIVVPAPNLVAVRELSRPVFCGTRLPRAARPEKKEGPGQIPLGLSTFGGRADAARQRRSCQPLRIVTATQGTTPFLLEPHLRSLGPFGRSGLLARRVTFTRAAAGSSQGESRNAEALAFFIPGLVASSAVVSILLVSSVCFSISVVPVLPN